MARAQAVMLVTGSTDGIGHQTALELLQKGARVLVHGRNANKANDAVNTLRKKSGSKDAEPVVGDLSSIQGAHDLAADVVKKTDVLDVVINNAGMYAPEKTLSPDGLELTFAVNHLGHFVLTHDLMPLLLKSAPSRLINVASMVHSGARLDFDNLRGEKRYDGYAAYAQSKLCNVLFTAEFSRRVDGKKVWTGSLHPGVINTKLLQQAFGSSGDPDLAAGAATSVWLATSEKVPESGRYYSNVREAQPSATARDKELAQKLWAESEKLAGITGPWL